MSLSPQAWEQVKSLFESALEQSPEHWQSFLAEKCQNKAVREEAARLLACQPKLGSFLNELKVDLSKTAPVSLAPAACAPGRVLADRFKVVAFLARGGMGEVYEAEDLELGESVAVKMMRPDLAKLDPHSLSRFKREVHLAKRVTHPNVCRIFDLFHHRGSVEGEGSGGEADLIFVTMELLRGETLYTRLGRRGRMNVAEAMPITTQILAGLEAAHAAGILHRDLKPSNVFIESSEGSREGRAVVTDFGLALGPPPEYGAETRTGSVGLRGTPQYMAPEQIEGGKLSAACDIYALGLLLYEMLTGSRPFEEDSPMVAAVRRLHDPPPPPHLLVPGLDANWERIILRCLQRNPADRYISVSEISRALHGDLDSSVPSRPKHPKLTSIAILPFWNAGANSETEYLSDGITESIINALACLPRLRVMASSTVFRYKNEQADPQMVGRQLNVSAVLTGRVAQHAEMLDVTTELVDVTNGWHLWGERYHRKLDDVLALQESIASEISVKLKLKLTGEEKKHLAKRHTRSADAYKLYLRGRYCWNKRGPADIRTAIDYFEEAIQADPSYALAYAGLADCYATQAFVLDEPAMDTMPKAREAAQRALHLDDNLAEAHASLAMVTARFDWDLPGAERGFQRALALNPGCTSAHQWYGECLAAMGRTREAIETLKRAQDADPLSAISNAVLAGMYYFGRRYPEAVEQAEKVLQLEQDFWPALLFLGASYEQLGRYPEAIKTLQHGVVASRRSSAVLAALGHACAAGGQRQKAQIILAALRDRALRQYVSPLYPALVALALQDDSLALTCLEKAAKERSGWLMFLAVDPRFDGLRSQPRYLTLANAIHAGTSANSACAGDHN